MFFNSLEFFLFLPIVFALYWAMPKHNILYKNVLILVASYVFYGWWDWRFLTLIVLSSVVDFAISQKLGQIEEKNKRKLLLITSLVMNLGLLMFFKYCNFFIDSFVDAFSFFGQQMDPQRLNIVLPVGISFYTFQTLSYTIDVYRKQLKPSHNWISFFAFVSFFPQLVAGPIERATNLLPQFKTEKKFDYVKSVDGLRQILWGFFKKIVIADNCAAMANRIFDHHENMPASMLIIGSVMFAFQIYCDFSGYSDIAIGLARLFGFDLKKNFAFPYFSRDIAEFWRRWHISLSTWFRDYLYIPLGGSKGTRGKKIRNTFLIFLVSGFWHGPNWTFIAWGGVNALLFLPLLLRNRNRKNTNTVAENKLFPSFSEFFGIITTFSLVCLAWIFFRAETLSDALIYISNLFNASILTLPVFELQEWFTLFFLVIFVGVEWVNRDKEYAIALNLKPKSRWFNWSAYLAILLIIVVFAGDLQDFIYFQF